MRKWPKNFIGRSLYYLIGLVLYITFSIPPEIYQNDSQRIVDMDKDTGLEYTSSPTSSARVSSSADPFYANTPASRERPSYHLGKENLASIDLFGCPLVTVVIPFTCSKFSLLPETLTSLKRQSLQQIEIIIVNDGCREEHIFAKLNHVALQDARIKITQLSPGHGLPAARNHGANMAKAQFIFFLDADDLIEPTALEKLLWYLVAHPNHAFARGYTVGFGALNYKWPHGFDKVEVIMEKNTATATAMVRKRMFDAVGGFRESDTGGLEDWDFWLRCAANGSWGGTVPEYLDWYRRRRNHDRDWTNLQSIDGFKLILRERYPSIYESRRFPIDERQQRSTSPTTNLSALVCQHPSTNDTNVIPRTSDFRRMIFILPWMVLGGADKYNLDLIKQLTNDGWDITIVATLPGPHTWFDAFYEVTNDIFILPNFLTDKNTYDAFLMYLLRSRQPDVIFVSNSEIGYAMLPLLQKIGKQLPQPPVFVDYVHMQEEWGDGGYAKYAIKYQSWTNITLVASENCKDWIVEHGGSRNRIKTCYIGTNITRFRPDYTAKQRLRGLLGISEDIPVILFAGRIVEQKQPDVLATVLRRLSLRGRFVALVAGDGPLLERLRAEVQRGFSDAHGAKVIFLGSKNENVMPDLLQVADIVFLPSQMEGIALIAYEAMSAGNVFVGADVGGQSEIISPQCDCGILIPKTNPARESIVYTNAIHKLLTDENMRAKFSHNARKRVEEMFGENEAVHNCFYSAIEMVAK